jgi:hypothetical protein
MLKSSSDTVIVTKPYSSVNTLRKPFKTPFKVPFKQPPQEANIMESSDAQHTTRKGEELNHDNDEIEGVEVCFNSARQALLDELVQDDVLEEEPVDFGQGSGDTFLDDGMSKCEQ